MKKLLNKNYNFMLHSTTKFNFLRKIITIILISIFLQSCYTYKTINFENLKTEKNYIIKLKEGTTINAQFKEKSLDSISLIVNKHIINFPKSKIQNIKIKKVSVLKLLGGGVLITTGVFILINDAPKSSYPGTAIE